MNPGGHIEAGWLLANAAPLDRSERRWVVGMAIACDVDALLLPWPDAYDALHRTFGHNLWFWLGAPLLVLFFAKPGRKRLVLAMAYLAMASHVLLDLASTGWWPMYPFWPFEGTVVFSSNWIPEETMKWIIQPALMVFLFGGLVGIYVWRKRTPLELLSPNVDSLIMNFILLPWRHRCGVCGKLAFYRCSDCGQTLCPNHRTLDWRLNVRCGCKK